MTILKLCLVLSLFSSCAAYRTNSDISFPSTNIKPYSGKVVLFHDPILNKKLTSLGVITGEVSKLTFGHKDPTKEQANYVLLHKAEELGADAVMNVSYEHGIGLFTWGYMEATGTAVKFDVPEK